MTCCRHVHQGGVSLHHGVHMFFCGRILLRISPCVSKPNPLAPGAMPSLGRDPRSNHQLNISIHFLHLSMAPSIKALLLSSKVASCFLLSPKRKVASPSALGQEGYSFTRTSIRTLEMILFDKQLLPQSRFPRHIQTLSSGKNMSSYTL